MCNQQHATCNLQPTSSLVYLKTLFILLILILVGCAPRVKKEVIGIGPSLRVHLATITSQDVISFTDDYYLVAEEARYEFGERNKSLTIVPITNGMQLHNENRNLLFRQHFPIIMEPKDENSHFVFKGNEYAGTIIFSPASDTSLYLINKLVLEEYLRGVVPAEIFTTKQEWFEAIKVQAICARTYALKKLEENKSNAFDLYSSVADQVYKGFDIHTELADKAIFETRGIILTYKTKPATVYYHSTCGGQLEAAENVWPDRGITYLKEGIDAVETYFSCSTSPHFRWNEQRSFAQLDSALDEHFQLGLLHKPANDTLSLASWMDITYGAFLLNPRRIILRVIFFISLRTVIPRYNYMGVVMATA
jgi:stage II sporulation protein D